MIALTHIALGSHQCDKLRGTFTLLLSLNNLDKQQNFINNSNKTECKETRKVIQNDGV